MYKYFYRDFQQKQKRDFYILIIRSMILSDRNCLKGFSGSAEGAAPSFSNRMVQGASSDQAFHSGSFRPQRSSPFGSPVLMKLQK